MILSRRCQCHVAQVQSCSRLLILCGESYVSRLWCVLELYIHFAMSGPRQASKRTIITDCRSSGASDDTGANAREKKRHLAVSNRRKMISTSLPRQAQDEHQQNRWVLSVFGVAGDLGGSSAAAAALHTFDVKDAHCFSAEDETRLRSVIESEGATTFNDAIREAAAELLGAPEGGGLRQSVREAGVVTNAAGALSFNKLDANGDKRLDREDLLAAFGWYATSHDDPCWRFKIAKQKRSCYQDTPMATIGDSSKTSFRQGRAAPRSGQAKAARGACATRSAGG